MRRGQWLTLSLVILGCCVAAPARAQSLYGPGGLFLHPTAAMQERGRLTPAAILLPEHNPPKHTTWLWLSGAVDYGVTKNLEAGLTVVKITAHYGGASEGGFLKYRLLEERRDRPAVAVGFTGLGFGAADTRIGFLAARKPAGTIRKLPIYLDAGVQYVDLRDGMSLHEFQPYGGIEVAVTPRLSLSAEARPRLRHEWGTPLALTAAYRVTRNWRLAVAWANNGASDRPFFAIGAGFSLGSRK